MGDARQEREREVVFGEFVFDCVRALVELGEAELRQGNVKNTTKWSARL